ncbi:ABC transporter [Novosphingobium sp. PC22D]|uniref:ABC transporter ATP-binding protein n=1 Tax=Novosphingobium sp. PC22D TaxID=1962403 RepID=UPI000BF0B50E|nr:ABC transporter ATP-binding protein [Novosphingobium sp. PC22D]PEQ13667.1 ABC transporter [Novosphingobium sp. PC22D]
MVTVEFEDLCVSLSGRPILKSVSARLEPGRLTGVIGPNGAGKSTLVRAILGLVRPDSGEIRLDGTDLSRHSRAQVARKLAYLPQGQTVHWPLGVERLVGLGRIPHLAPADRLSSDDRAAIHRAMARADVLDLRARIATQLSGGERARVLLARALAVGAAGLVADEPLASLDAGHQLDVMDLLRREAASGALVVAVLHDLTLAARYCARLLLVDRGEIVADGSPLAVLTPDRLEAVYGIRARIEPMGDGVLIVPLERVAAKETQR